MDLPTLRRRLMALGHETEVENAGYGTKDRVAIVAALTEGPDWALEPEEVNRVAAAWDVHPAKIWAFVDIESTGNPFIDGRPTILFEPHRFSKATGHRFDRSNPSVSYPNWGDAPYPKSQQGRYDQLLQAVELDVDAAFASASYGAFQILGENYAICGAPTPWAFAWRQAQTVGDQFEAFCRFIEAKKLVPAMRAAKPNDPASCVPLVKPYNGTAYGKNNYHTRYARQIAKRMGA
jgi:hypothetical protein